MYSLQIQIGLSAGRFATGHSLIFTCNLHW